MNLEFFIKNILVTYVIPGFDILIMTFVIFYLYLFIEKTKAENLAKGVLIVLVILFVLELLNFQVIKLVFDKILYNLILIIFLLFSTEIRGILISLGKKTPYRNIPRADVQFINIIVKAIEDLASRKIGAIIVIARKDDVIRLCTSFIPMDAGVSEEMFNIVFDKKSLVHDGAMIFRERRIHAVSAILPLSNADPESDKLDKHMGTRHRAALGITEESDAISIVASEQTGNISFFENGTIMKNITSADMKKYLKSSLYEVEAEHG